MARRNTLTLIFVENRSNMGGIYPYISAEARFEFTMNIEARSDHLVNEADGLMESISANRIVNRDFMHLSTNACTLVLTS